jgi:Domain of unknown function (DUF4332)
MTKCTCCGQQIEPQTSDALYAQEALLECCDHASTRALSEGSREIEIAHLAIALVQSPVARLVLERNGIGGSELEHAAVLQLASGARFEHRAAPEPSAEYLEVLRRAESATLQSGGDTVTLECVVEILIHHSADLAGAAFLGGSDSYAVEEHAAHGYESSIYEADRGRLGSARVDRLAEMTGTAANDPFQLNVNLPTLDEVYEETASASETERPFGLHVASGWHESETGASGDASIVLRSVEQQLLEMKELLGKISTRVQSLETGGFSGNAKNDRADGVNDLSYGSNRSGHAHRRSLGNRYRRWKFRIRVARQGGRRRQSTGYYEQEKVFSDSAQLNDGEAWQSSNPPLEVLGTGDVRQARDQDQSDEPSGSAEKRFYLDIDDPIICSPSIGERTAERLIPLGIERVRDLLDADAADLAEAVDARHITVRRIEDWQMQARLVCMIPWLRATHAQLLVGAGYTTPGDICEATGDTLSADILQFASTRDGQRILRSGQPPELEKMLKWAEYAELAELDRAA